MAEFARTLERYDVIDHIATGGMAEVFLGKAYGSHGFEKTIAIKRILPEFAKEPEFERRFIAEAKVAVRLSHNNIVQVLDFGRFGESLFIAMEYVDGLDLTGFLRKYRDANRPVPLAAAWQISLDILRGLAYAHDQGVVHRDVSPSNVLLSRAGEVKLADFGIALAHAGSKPRGGGMVMGKWRYMSPEQAVGEPLDRRSDIFSAAIVCFEIFTGEKLFDGKTPAEIATSIREAPIPLIASRRADVPPRIDEILARALARNPGARPARALELISELTDLSYETKIVASATAVADALNDICPRNPSAHLSADELIRKHLLPSAGAPMDRATEFENDPSSATGLGTTQILVQRDGTDGLTRLVPKQVEAAESVDVTRIASPRARTASVAPLPRVAPTAQVAAQRPRRVGWLLVGVLGVGALGVVVWPRRPDDVGIDTPRIAAEATLDIDSTPPADIVVDGVVVGVTPQLVTVPSDRPIVVELRAPGYRTFRWERTVAAGVSRVLEQTLERLPAELVVTSSPSGAEVSVAGQVMGQTPLTLQLPERAGMTLAVALSGYERATGTADLVAGQSQTKHFSLSAITRTGQLNIHIESGWADVYLRGKKIGRAPIQGLRLPVGRHRLELRNPVTGKSRTLPVQAVADKTTYYSVSL